MGKTSATAEPMYENSGVYGHNAVSPWSKFGIRLGEFEQATGATGILVKLSPMSIERTTAVQVGAMEQDRQCTIQLAPDSGTFLFTTGVQRIISRIL